jgi:hypothetical protein
MAQDRTAVPASVKREVLAEAGHMCANPRCRAFILELHHIVWVKDGGGNDAPNLVPLCPNCHALHTRGVIPRSSIERWKLMLMRLSDALDRESLDLLIFLYRLEREHEADPKASLVVTGDGLLRLARLVNTGLVDLRRSAPFTGYGPWNVWEPRLTDLDNRLVEAWIDGDAATVRELLLGTASSSST